MRVVEAVTVTVGGPARVTKRQETSSHTLNSSEVGSKSKWFGYCFIKHVQRPGSGNLHTATQGLCVHPVQQRHRPTTGQLGSIYGVYQVHVMFCNINWQYVTSM